MYLAISWPIESVENINTNNNIIKNDNSNKIYILNVMNVCLYHDNYCANGQRGEFVFNFIFSINFVTFLWYTDECLDKILLW